jgi:AraC family transcriptional regulator
LKSLGNAVPGGLLQVTLEPSTLPSAEGTELTYLHGVAITADTPSPEDLASIPAPAGSWAVFTTEGPHPQALQATWAATAAEWFPSNAWRLRPGPSLVSVLEHDEDFTTATCELWLPVERAD